MEDRGEEGVFACVYDVMDEKQCTQIIDRKDGTAWKHRIDRSPDTNSGADVPPVFRLHGRQRERWQVDRAQRHDDGGHGPQQGQSGSLLRGRSGQVHGVSHIHGRVLEIPESEHCIDRNPDTDRGHDEGGGGGGGGSKAACVTTATRMEPDGGCYQAGADGNAEPPTMTAGNGYEQYTEGARGRALMSAKRTLTQAAPVHQVA